MQLPAIPVGDGPLSDNCYFIFWLGNALNVIKFFFFLQVSKKINDEWNTDVQIYMAH